MSGSAKRERLAVSRPTEGAAGQTGSWRVFRPVVDKEKCNECGFCAMYCPTVRSTMISWSTSGSARAVASALTNARKKPSPW